MDVEADVAVGHDPTFARMQTHPDPDRLAARPGVGRQGMLGGNDGLHGILRTGKHDKERVALGPQFDATVSGERRPHQTALVLEDVPPLIPKLLEETGGSLDVREEEGDGSGREYRRAGHGWLVHRFERPVLARRRTRKPEEPARFANLTRAGSRLQACFRTAETGSNPIEPNARWRQAPARRG